MENLLFTLLFIFLPLWFIVILKRAINNFIKENLNSRLPPGPRKLPIIGNLHQMSGLPHQTLRNLAKEHGPLMHQQLGEVSAVVVSSPKVAQQIMKTHDLSFADRGELLSAKILTYGYKDVAFAPYGDYWRQMKKIFTLELLSARRVLSFRSLREKEVSKLIQSISLTGAGSQINLGKRIYSLTSDVVCQAAFGHKCEENEELISLMNQVINMASGFDIADVFPSLEFLHIISGMKPKLKTLFHKVDKILEKIIRKHLEHRPAFKDHNMHEVKEDLLDVLLRVKEQGELDFPITNENIKAVMVVRLSLHQTNLYFIRL
ncbi:hypothetical protein MKW92_009464 [Papaver armeniacum]|nr:hypothetical protein MKW92_009464 [Papaver armeniacum]